MSNPASVSSRSVDLKRFGIAALVLAAAAWADAAATLHDAGVGREVAYALETFFKYLPIAASSAIATLPRATRRDGVRIALACAGLMLLVDFAPASGVYGVRSELLQASDDTWQLRSPIERLASDGGLVLVIAHLRGQVEGVNEIQAVFPVDHPRIAVTEAWTAMTHLLAPIYTVGLTLLLINGVRRAVVFKSRAAEVGSRFLFAAVAPLLVMVAAWEAADTLRVEVVMRDAPMWSFMMPALTLVAISLIGWVMARPVDYA